MKFNSANVEFQDLAAGFSHMSGEAVLAQILAESLGESSDSDEIYSVENRINFIRITTNLFC